MNISFIFLIFFVQKRNWLSNLMEKYMNFKKSMMKTGQQF
jgi:hypothetical protein